jgi:hypothetical protein
MKFFGGKGQRRTMRQLTKGEKSPQVDPSMYEPKQPEKGECKCDRFKTVHKEVPGGMPGLIQCRDCGQQYHKAGEFKYPEEGFKLKPRPINLKGTR